MDITTILGLLVGWGALVIGVIMEGAKVTQFLQLSAFIIILVGTFGATLISFSLEQMLSLPMIAKNAFFGKKFEVTEIANLIVSLAEKARREGMLALDNEIQSIGDQFLQNGVQLVVDGNDAQRIRSILETEVAFLEERHKVGENIFMTLGGFAPTLGIIGTVMGLIFALSHGAEDPAETVKAIAVAFLATFYGISFANLIFLPIANKLKLRNEEEMLLKEVIIEGVLAIQAGESPRLVEERLKVFLPPSKRIQVSGKRQTASESPGAPEESRK